LAVVVVVLVPAAVVVVVPPAAVVVVVDPVLVVVVVDFPELWAGLLDDFFVAEGVPEPQAAATRPAATMIAPTFSDVAMRRRSRRFNGPVDSVVVAKVIRPHSSFVVACRARSKTLTRNTPIAQRAERILD
jgi:hypothetical protein